MKDKIKYLIHKLFIYNDISVVDDNIASCLINLLIKTYQDFIDDNLINKILNIYEVNSYNKNASINLTGYNFIPILPSDYNELYLSLYEMKKSLI